MLAISQRVGISPRTLQRHFSANYAKKGSAKAELVEAARLELIKSVTNSDAIKGAVARLISDDIAHATHLRTILQEASEHLKATSLQDAVLVMRGAAAYSTALKNTSDTIRKNLPIKVLDGLEDSDLPVLTIRTLTAEEIEELRAQAKQSGIH